VTESGFNERWRVAETLKAPTAQFPRFVQGRSLDLGQFGDVPADVLTVGIVAEGLAQNVEAAVGAGVVSGAGPHQRERILITTVLVLKLRQMRATSETGPAATPAKERAEPPHARWADWVSRVIDVALEVSVVGSFSRFGPVIRNWSEGWVEPPAPAGRVLVVTGATSGLGLAVADRLGALGARVCVVGRDRQRLDVTRLELERSGGGEVTVEQADLAHLGQVHALAGRIAQRFGRLDVLVHNAGVLLRQRAATVTGLDATVAVNLLAPYLLTERLLPLLRASAPSRVITMTSAGMYTQRFRVDGLVMEEGHYNGMVAYARAKRAQVVLTEEWQRRYGELGVGFHCVHPGWAATPGLAASLPTFSKVMGPLLRSPAEGADTAAWLAGAPDGTPPGGRLWLDRRPRGAYRLPWTWAPASLRQADGVALWNWCAAQITEQLGEQVACS
jgi:dehydrogenase/reductase SDR family member 12